jgi:lipopolysaccharide export system protein LptA
MTVEGHAFMRFPAGELAPPGTNVTGAVKPKPTASTTNQFAEVFSKEYTLRREQDRVIGRFLGGVRIRHPQLDLTTEAMTVELPPEGRQVERIVAERGVKFDMVDQRGQKHHGEGVRLVYTHNVSAAATNDLVVLIGSPAILQTTNGPTARNNVFNMDLTTGVISGTGTYEFTGVTDAIDTNKFKWPTREPGHKQ